MRHRPWAALGAVVVASLVSGCGVDGSPGGTAPAAEGARTIEVAGASLAFVPERIEIEAGADVAIALRSTDVEHTLVIDEVGFFVAARRGQRRAGGLRVDVPGVYTAYCSVPGHRAGGMELTVTVR